MPLKRYSLNFDTELMAQVEAYAQQLHINRSAALSVLISQALQAQKGIDALSMLTDVVKAQQLAAGAGAAPQIGGKPDQDSLK